MIEKVKKYCTLLLSGPEIKKMPFHNLKHTQEVVHNVKCITTEMGLTVDETEILIVAAWFHDTGFTKTYKNHEEASKEIAIKFLKETNLNQKKIEQICSCIEATKMPQKPITELEKILCDADIFHTSNLNFYYRKLLLKREWEIYFDMKTTDKEWHLLNLDFLENFNFKSNYGKKFLEAGKQENVKRVKQILKYYE